jgi:hypothetical protein
MQLRATKRETGSFMQRRLIKGSVVVHYDGGHPELARCVHIFIIMMMM